MHRPTIAVFWQVWEHRWVLLGSALYFVAVSSLSLVVPRGEILGVLQFAMVSPLLTGLIPLFVYAVDADLAGRDSTFPARMFTLPLTTRALVGWPMLYGAVAIALAWMAAAILALRPGGLDVPLWWPAGLLAGCLAWVQAMAWRPFGLPGLRLVAAVVLIGALVAMSGLRWMAHLPEVVVSLLLVCTIPPAYIVAVRGVSRARRGDQPDWQRLVAWPRSFAGWFSRRGRFFGSPSRAQVWFEWRRNGLGLPILVALMILFLVTLITVSRHNPRHSPNSLFRSPILLLAIPLLAAVTVGGGWGRCGDSHSGQAIPAFLATRPITCAGLIWAKMKAAAISAAVVWGMTLAAVVLMVLVTGSWAELAGQWSVLTKDLSAGQKATMVTLGVVLLLAGTWKPMIANLFLGLAGRRWVWTVGAFAMGSAMVAAVLLACWLSLHPEYHDALLAAMPWTVGLAAVLKLLVGGWLARVIVRRHLVQARLAARLLAAWLLTAAGLTGLLCWLVPHSLAPWYLVAACVVLAMPLVRISLAPLALAWNRHR
jgi:hypothetical protein